MIIDNLSGKNIGYDETLEWSGWIVVSEICAEARKISFIKEEIYRASQFVFFREGRPTPKK